MLQQDRHYRGTATDLTMDGDAVVRIEDFVVFVPGLLPNETAQIRIKKVKKSFAFGEVLHREDDSPFRADPPCPHFSECGGCTLQHLAYSAQLDIKRNMVTQTLARIAGLSTAANPVLGMDDPYRYRNKVVFQVRGYDLGFFAKKSNRFVNIRSCLLLSGDTNELKRKLEGFLREHKLSVERITIRRSQKNTDFMVMLHGRAPNSTHRKRLQEWFTAIPEVSSLLWMDTAEHKYYHLGGTDYLEEEILGFSFRVSPLAFMQVNHGQMQSLYAYALHRASLTPDDDVLDLYCGMGSITLHIAKNAGRVIGIEEVHSAVRDAELNARLNLVDNAFFLTGRVEERLRDLPDGFHPDVVFLDPPRAGVDAHVLEELCTLAPNRMVYISCNPATLARDLKALCADGAYRVQDVQPVDLFGQSMHVETVCLLTRK